MVKAERSIGVVLSMLLTLCLLSAAAVAGAAPPACKLLPPSFTLYGPHVSQRVVLEKQNRAAASGSFRTKTVYTSSNPRVAAVDASGLVVPRGDGACSITARMGSSYASAGVRVAGFHGGKPWSFRNDVLPVLTKAGCNGGSCHGAAAGKGGLKLSLRGFDPDSDYNVLTHQANGRRVAPGSPQNSLMLLKPTMQIPHGGGRRFPAGSREAAAIAGWIAEGAPRPETTDARIESLDIVPPVASLHPGEIQQVLVTARYSDGSSRDVTSLVKFGSGDDTVASVNDRGLVTASGRGEAPITAWYASKVNYMRIVSPFAAMPRAGTIGAAGESQIDKLVNSKLAELNIPASPECSDADFLRRASLDATGALPGLEEAREFLADRSPDRRERLVDRLLATPEYVDYWAYKWSDLLLLNSKNMPAESLNAFYGYIHKSVEQNKPWNRFVQEIVTARGSTLDNGAAAFFVIHKDPFDLTETTTQAFMGLSLMCAHCHNHPLEKWTQKDYYQMANLYARVRLKNGDRPGEVLTLAADSGDIPHPRLGTALAPRTLDGPELNPNDPTDRRIKLAEWLTGPSNPAFAKCIVNRVWRNFMGRGLVEPEDDLRATNPPTNAPLMDALADEFIRNGYDVKRLIREIMLSRTYQRSSDPTGVNRTDEKYFSHYIIRRLPAEPLLDAIAVVTGVPTAYKDLPKNTRALQLKDSQVESYFLTAFGRPLREKTCACERQQDPDVAQALDLSNGEVINARLKAAGGAVDKLISTGASGADAMERLYLTALCRYPTPAEKATALKLLGPAGEQSLADHDRMERRAAFEDLFWAVLTSREFVFNH